MPIISNPSRVLLGGVREVQDTNLAQQRGDSEFTGITEEVVAEATGNGLYRIDGRNELLATSGVQKPIAIGEIVDVAWRGSVPIVILSHTARRAKHVPPIGNPAIPVVEELFSANNTIWFRNSTQFTQLLPPGESTTPVTPGDLGLSSIGLVHWGKGNANFVLVEGLLTGDVVWVFCTLNRPKKNEPFPNGTKVRITPVKAYNLSASAATFGNYSITVDPGGHIASADLKYVNTQISVSGAPDTSVNMSTIATTAQFQAIAPNGDLLVTLSLFAQADGAGVAQVAFKLGSLLINVTKSVVLANKIANVLTTQVFDNQTPAATPVCTVLGSAEFAINTGGSAVGAGDITVLSVKGEDPNEVGTFNNYALLGPARFQGADTLFSPPPGSIFCYPTRPDLLLSIVGESFGPIENFPGSDQGPSVSQTPLFQGSRTMMLFGTFSETGNPLAPLKIAWLPRGKVSIIVHALSTDVFDSASPFAPFFPQDWLQARAYFATQASQVYTPRENLPYSFPSNPPIKPLFANGRPNFVISKLNKTSGVMQIDESVPVVALNGRGLIFAPKTDEQKAIITNFPLSDIQVLDSPNSLGSAFQSGPL